MNSLTQIITVLSFIASASLTTPTKAQQADNDSCEKGSMAEVYACLDEKRQSTLDAVYDKLALKFSTAEKINLLERLTDSQRAWLESVEIYCDILIDAATPDYGLYANDIGNNCRTQLYSQRVEELLRLIDVFESKNFIHWTDD